MTPAPPLREATEKCRQAAPLQPSRFLPFFAAAHRFFAANASRFRVPHSSASSLRLRRVGAPSDAAGPSEPLSDFVDLEGDLTQSVAEAYEGGFNDDLSTDVCGISRDHIQQESLAGNLGDDSASCAMKLSARPE